MQQQTQHKHNLTFDSSTILRPENVHSTKKRTYERSHYLCKLRCPGEDGPQRLDEVLLGDAVGVIRRLRWMDGGYGEIKVKQEEINRLLKHT